MIGNVVPRRSEVFGDLLRETRNKSFSPFKVCNDCAWVDILVIFFNSTAKMLVIYSEFRYISWPYFNSNYDVIIYNMNMLISLVEKNPRNIPKFTINHEHFRCAIEKKTNISTHAQSRLILRM